MFWVPVINTSLPQVESQHSQSTQTFLCLFFASVGSLKGTFLWNVPYKTQRWNQSQMSAFRECMTDSKAWKMSFVFLSLHSSTDSLLGTRPLLSNKKIRYCSLSRFWFLWWFVLNNWWNYGLPFLVTWKHFFPSWPLNSTGIQYIPLSSKVVCNHSQRLQIHQLKVGWCRGSDWKLLSFI